MTIQTQTAAAQTTFPRVLSYDSAEVLDGAPTAELARESESAGPTGAVPAYLDGGRWEYCAPSDRSRIVAQGYDVVTVYVEVA